MPKPQHPDCVTCGHGASMHSNQYRPSGTSFPCFSRLCPCEAYDSGDPSIKLGVAKANLVEQIAELLKKNPRGLTVAEIAAALGQEARIVEGFLGVGARDGRWQKVWRTALPDGSGGPAVALRPEGSAEAPRG